MAVKFLEKFQIVLDNLIGPLEWIMLFLVIGGGIYLKSVPWGVLDGSGGHLGPSWPLEDTKSETCMKK